MGVGASVRNGPPNTTRQPSREWSRDSLAPWDPWNLYDFLARLGLSGFVRTVSLFTCGICCNELPSAEAVSLPTSCHHGPVCRSCLAKHLAGQILTHGRSLVREHCLITTAICCDWRDLSDSRRKKRAAWWRQPATRYIEQDIVQNTRPKQVQAWREHNFRRAIELLPGFRWCSNTQCTFGQQMEDCDNYPIMICNDYGAKVIFWGAHLSQAAW